MTLISRLRSAKFIKLSAPVLNFALAFLVLLSTLHSAVASGSRAHIIVGGREALFMVSPTVDGDTISGPVDFVRLMGADYTVNDSKTLTVISATGQKFNAPYTSADDRQIVSMKPIIAELGADQSWDPSSNSLTLRAKVLMVKVDSGKLTVVTSFPIDSVSGTLDNPARAYVDLFGATLSSDGTTIPVNSGGVKRIRSKQMEFNTVRIALDMMRTPTIASGSLPKTNRIQLVLGTGSAPTSIASANVPTRPIISAAPTKTTPQLSDPVVPITGIPSPDSSTASTSGLDTMPSGAFRITDIESTPDADGNLQIVIKTEGKSPDGNPRTVMLATPDRFAVDLAGADLALPPNFDNGQLDVSNPVVKAVRWGTYKLNNDSCGRIVLDLIHPALFKIATEATDDGGQQYRITLSETDSDIQTATTQTAPPDANATADLTGRVIVIDPGHGGKDGGAPGANGLWEKDLTLQIGKKVRDTLVAAGAKVLMTRDDDTFIPLPDRAELGVDNHADLFVSIHCDSGSARNSNEGSTVYYHGNDSTCKQFAQFVASRLEDSNCGVHNNGTRTDYVRFPGIGFAVLRRSTEPAILVECGYVNNDQDATALQSSDTQDLIAKSVVAGVKDFLSNRVATNITDPTADR